MENMIKKKKIILVVLDKGFEGVRNVYFFKVRNHQDVNANTKSKIQAKMLNTCIILLLLDDCEECVQLKIPVAT